MKKVALGTGLVFLSGILVTISMLGIIACIMYQGSSPIYQSAYYGTAIRYGIWSLISFAFGIRMLINKKGVIE